MEVCGEGGRQAPSGADPKGEKRGSFGVFGGAVPSRLPGMGKWHQMKPKTVGVWEAWMEAAGQKVGDGKSAAVCKIQVV